MFFALILFSSCFHPGFILVSSFHPGFILAAKLLPRSPRFILVSSWFSSWFHPPHPGFILVQPSPQNCSKILSLLSAVFPFHPGVHPGGRHHQDERENIRMIHPFILVSAPLCKLTIPNYRIPKSRMSKECKKNTILNLKNWRCQISQFHKSQNPKTK